MPSALRPTSDRWVLKPESPEVQAVHYLRLESGRAIRFSENEALSPAMETLPGEIFNRGDATWQYDAAQ
ncbi:hypothetical protein F1880_008929 [Penicillium rolfsii]|nr:hypothetical protein F1880_008929 [Penicillium rolfsii]